MATRRDFLLGAGAMVSAMGLPLPVQAKTPGGMKFIFVFNPGGWDPTRVFATTFDHASVDMEGVAERGTVGGISFVDHAERPSVRAFFERHHADTLVINGLMVRSIAHEICTMISLTGTSSGLSPDWPAVMAAQERDLYVLPHLVLDGPSFPGNLGVAVSRTGVNGQLEALISGEALEWSDTPVQAQGSVRESIIDRYMLRRAQARADGAAGAIEQRLTGDYLGSMEKLTALKGLRYTMDFTGGTELEQQALVAVEALAEGVSRCVTIAHPGGGGGQFGWDTHADNDNAQSPLWEGLFSGLGLLLETLQTTPGEYAATLADETMVVVLSEMGRTPLLNATDGKDHWPYTSAMLVGKGITGDRVIGGYDEAYYGFPIDPGSGDVDEGGQVLSAEALGATLLTMAGIDSEPYVSGVEPLSGILA